MMKNILLTFILVILPTISAAGSKCIPPNYNVINEDGDALFRLDEISSDVSIFNVVGTSKERAYFYSEASDNCKTDKFVIVGDKVNGFEIAGDYIHASYVNPKTGGSAKGWIKQTQLEQSGDNTTSGNVNKILGGVGAFGDQDIKSYDITCFNGETYDISYNKYLHPHPWGSNTFELVEEYSTNTASVKEFAESFCKGKRKS